MAPASAVRHIPAGFSFDQAANFAGNYETAYHCLVARGQVTAEDTVLIHGASGSTGLAAVHVAKLLGATVIATDGTPQLHSIHNNGRDVDYVRFTLDERAEVTAARPRPPRGRDVP